VVVLLDEIVLEYLEGLNFLDGQISGSMEVIPVKAQFDGSFEYLTLGEAMKSGFLKVEEIDESGSVPEVLVVNKATLPVLIVDGEELEGAKQNRIVNTSILLREKSKTIIPVSCVEAGRWHYTSKDFRDSGRVAAKCVRFEKSVSVTESLEGSSEYLSDQRAVWDAVDRLHSISGSYSVTGAMDAAFQKHENRLEEFIKPFKVSEGQNGILVAIDGVIVGLEFVSRHSTYKKLHDKIIKSYAIEALSRGETDPLTKDDIKTFIDEITSSKETRKESPGYGFDYRFRSENCIGSALIYQKEIIHGVFFRLDKDERMARRKDRISSRLNLEM